MELSEFSSAQVQQRGNQLLVSHGDDKSLLVTFYMESVRQGAESEKAGRNIFKDEPFIWIRFAGDKTREIKRRVDLRGKNGQPPDPERFPRQWAAFQNSQAEVHEGTPLEEWGPIAKSEALNYKGLNIHTVEQLASVGDHLLHNLGHGARELRDKAIAWLRASTDSSETLRLQAENDRLREDLEALKQQVAELAQKKRGRPPKGEAE
jgi:hypothetical protein